jgi:flagellar protein FliO/FliZ
MFHLFPADLTGDKKVINEAQYFEKIKSSMDKDGKTVDTGNQSKDKKINLSKGYFEYIKIIIILGLIVLVIYLIFRFLRKALKIKDDVGDKAVILSSQSLGPGKWIQVVYITGKYLILGVTNDSVNLIMEITDPKEIERLDLQINTRKTEEGNSFIDILSGIIKGKPKDEEGQKKAFDYESDSLDFLKRQKERLDKIDDE